MRNDTFPTRHYLYFVCFNMAALEDEDVIEDEQLQSLLVFPPEVQEAVDQVLFHNKDVGVIAYRPYQE